jgi:hypothetical protein
MKLLYTFFFLLPIVLLEAFPQIRSSDITHKVWKLDNSIFKNNRYWRGADGAASVDLGDGRVLWLFSDTFIDVKGSGKRVNSTMIRNSIAIQNGYDISNASFTFYYNGTPDSPDDYFKLPGDTWLWTGHGVKVEDKLVVFLFEEEATEEGLGFQPVGWYLAIIYNPEDNPSEWKIDYYKGPKKFEVLAGSSAVLLAGPYILIYAVGYYNNEQDVYLFRYKKNAVKWEPIKSFNLGS